jgi:hypothetical protein
MYHRYRTQLASDVTRDGLGVELMDENGTVVAEVFRSDRDRTVIVTTFNSEIPLAAMERLITLAKKRLDPFQDGAPLDSAVTVPPTAVRKSL